jgi:hypothetical protein
MTQLDPDVYLAHIHILLSTKHGHQPRRQGQPRARARAQVPGPDAPSLLLRRRLRWRGGVGTLHSLHASNKRYRARLSWLEEDVEERRCWI